MKKKKEKFPIRLYEAMKHELREHKSSFIIYNILRFLVICMMIFEILNRSYESAFLCVLTLILLIIPSFFQVALRIEVPTVLEITILFFIFAAEILGEICNFYSIFPFWDTVLHTLNGFLTAAIGLSLVQLLNKSDKLLFQLSPLFTSIVAFCFSSVSLNSSGENIPIIIKDIQDVTVSGKDLALGGYLDIGLIDTMQDLLVNFIGALVFSILGFFYVKNKDKDSVIVKLILHRKDKDKDYLSY